MWSRVPRDSEPRMNVLARPRSNCKLEIHPLMREMLYKDYDRRCSNEKENSDRESQGARRQDELIGSKLPVLK
jgi:hypothetical protein